MMRMKNKTLLVCMSALLLAGCTQQTQQYEEDRISVGIMLSDNGLGDQSFSDTGFQGAIKARDELGIVFDYKEIAETETYEKGFEELVHEHHDLIIGLGFSVQEDLEKVAKKYPNQPFVLVDSSSTLENIVNLNFKEEEGSYLAGILAGLKTKTNKIGFIGGFDNDLINKFAAGFTSGVRSVNPAAQVDIQYANDFGDDQLGATMAKEMIDHQADVLYAAAGFTGFGVLKQAEQSGVLAIGVDTDQYFVAEKAVMSSVVKRIDVAIYDTVKEYIKGEKLAHKDYVMGLNEQGIDLAPIRVVELTKEEQQIIDQAKEEIISGNIVVPSILEEEVTK